MSATPELRETTPSGGELEQFGACPEVTRSPGNFWVLMFGHHPLII